MEARETTHRYPLREGLPPLPDHMRHLEVVRTAAGVVRTARPDPWVTAVVREWWDALRGALEELEGAP